MYDVAQKIIEKFGGHKAVADALGLDITRVYRFTYDKSRGGTGGLIPAPHQQTLLQKAKELGVNITCSDFFQDTKKQPSQKINKATNGAVTADDFYNLPYPIKNIHSNATGDLE